VLSNFKYSLFEYAIQLAKGEISQEEFMAKNITTALGAVLLIIPGYFSDILGILFQFSAFTSMAVNRYNVKSGKCNTDFKQNNIKKDSDVIDVEIISDNATIK
jgi:UPF0716 family protein affecting phage T7 exclusion